jgi:hypothetical protein
MSLSRGRIALLVLLLLGSVALSVFVAVPAQWTQGRQLREYKYSDASEAPVAAVDQLTKTLAGVIDPSDMGILRKALKGVVDLPLHEDAPLKAYLMMLSDVSENMIDIDAKLQDAEISISMGKDARAEADLRELKVLRDETRPLLVSLHAQLEEAKEYVKMDTTALEQRLSALDVLFQTYTQRIDQAETRLQKMQQGLVKTALTLYAARVQIFIEEPLLLYGFLRQENGTALANRNVILTGGTNSTTTSTTDSEGRFEATISFPIGFPAGTARIDADFRPEGSDSEVYLPSTSSLEIEVEYYPSKIEAEISPKSLRALDSATVSGTLSSSEGTPLESRSLAFYLDDAFLGKSTTDSSGLFFFGFSAPLTLCNGTHVLVVTFAGIGDRFGPSNATLPFVVEVLATELQLALDHTSLFSGTDVRVNGTLRYTDGTGVAYESVLIFIDDARLTSAITNGDGSFGVVVEVPSWVGFGSHVVTVTYNSGRAWVQGSEASTPVFIYNTPFLILAAVGVASASTAGVYLIRRSRRAAVLAPPAAPEPVVVKRPPMAEELSSEKIILAIEAERDHSAKIRRIYRLAQDVIGQGLEEVARESETHWEYYSRVIKRAPSLKVTLKRLVELFELVEYSAFPIDIAESREAEQAVLKLREEIEAVR